MFNRKSRGAKRRTTYEILPAQTATVRLTDDKMLATDERDEYLSTTETELLARSILKRASKRAKEYVPGFEFSIEITEPHLEVHQTALMLALMYQASRMRGSKLIYLTVTGAKTVQFRA